MASLMSSLGDLLVCPVCKEVYCQPRSLPCQHNLCHKCLSTLITKIRELERKSTDFPCPVCRNVTKLPEGTIDLQVASFPVNRLVLSMMDAMMAHEDDWPKCKFHPDKSADLVCVTHDILVCSKCILKDHKHCRVLDMSDYVKSEFYTVKCSEVSDRLKRYKQHLKTIVSEIGFKMEDVSKDEENLLLDLNSMRETINKTFDSIQEKLTSKSSQYRSNGINTLQKQKAMLEELVSDIETSMGEMDESRESDVASKKLLLLRTAEANLKMVDVEIGSITFLPASFRLKATSKFETAMSMLRDSIDIETIDTRIEIPPVPPTIRTQPITPKKEKALSAQDICAVKIKECGMRLHSDESPCDVTGTAIMPDGRIVLVDFNNKKLKVIDKDLKLLTDFKMDHNVFDAAVVNESQIAITMPREKMIHLISLQDGSKSAESIATRLECWGIDTLDDKFVTVTSSDCHMVLIMNRKGVELVSANLGTHDPNLMWPISVCVDTRDRIFIACQGDGHSDEVKGSLIMVDRSGEVKHMFIDDNLVKPTSCTKDEDGNIYVCGLDSANVYQVGRSGDQLCPVISGLYKPIHINFENVTNSLFITERFCDIIGVYNLQ